ncbi:PEGA domain-containing protein [Deinococcus koreensis]|uniref:PEGA domain-containing protein n=1 Tax=Deinococcus koreensis TaxID=2054903 RepID=A0A2K3UXF4_9DEIO|nr:PEGA domain-containing protein [Deinococcus koreensis]PNY81223.1 hypothetical protein CVO96_07365 [Deinococcus koreensis]
MKQLGWSLLLAGLLAGCAPAVLRAQPGAQLRVETRLATAPLNTVTGERLYREPGPGALLIQTDRPAFVTSLLVPAQGGVRVLPAGPVRSGETVSLPLPGALGFTQVFTVASLAPVDLSAAQGARTLDAAAQAVQAATRSLGAGAYTVSTTTYTVGRFGSLEVTAPLPGAEVRVNGTLAGRTPLLLPEVPVGSVVVSVSRPGFTDFSQRVNVQPGTVSAVRASLRPITGTLQVTSGVPARVIVDGQPAGQTGPDGLSLALRPGTVGVNVVPLDSALKPQNLLVRIRASLTTTIDCAVVAGDYTCRTP